MRVHYSWDEHNSQNCGNTFDKKPKSLHRMPDKHTKREKERVSVSLISFVACNLLKGTEFFFNLRRQTCLRCINT